MYDNVYEAYSFLFWNSDDINTAFKVSMYFQDSWNFQTRTVGLLDGFFFSFTSMFSAEGFGFSL